MLKSKHKHEYELCLLEDDKYEDKYIIRATYCTICGKIGNRYLLETSEEPGKNYGTLLSSKEVKMKYSKLRLFKTIDIFNNYVDVL